MTSTIKVNTITKKCGSTLTLGESGTTVAIACGATTCGMGRTGTVDWQTGSIKTTTFTATNGEGYFCNTSGGAFTVNLPAGSAGAIVSVADYTRSFVTYNLTVSPDGSEKIGGVAANASLNVDGQSATFVYVDANEGWINIQETQSSQTGMTYMCASVSGACNTLTTAPDCANAKIAKFVGPGTFTVNTEVTYSTTRSIQVTAGEVVADTFNINTYRTAKYIVSCEDYTVGAKAYWTGEILLVHDGTNTNHTIYGEVEIGQISMSPTIASDIQGTDVRLKITTSSDQQVVTSHRTVCTNYSGYAW